MQDKKSSKSEKYGIFLFIKKNIKLLIWYFWKYIFERVNPVFTDDHVIYMLNSFAV